MAGGLRVDANEMKYGVLEHHGRLLDIFDVLTVLEVGVGQHDMAGTMRLGQHALELDLRNAPVGTLVADVPPHMRDVGATVAGPPLCLPRRLPTHLLHEACKVRPSSCW